MALLLTGCGAGAEREADRLQVGLVYYNENDTFLTELLSCFGDEISALQDSTESVNKKGGSRPQASLTVRTGAMAQRTEDRRVEELLEAGCNVLCVNLVDRTAPVQIIDMAREREVPVIFFNREPVREDLLRWDRLYYIGSDAKEAGTMQGEMAAAAIRTDVRADRNRDGRIQFVVMQGEPGHQDVIVRTENAVRTLQSELQGSGLTLDKLSYQIANWNRAQARTKMEQLLQQYGSTIELVLCNNDDMALGVLDAYDASDMTEASRPLIFGTDGTKEGLQAVADGRLQGTVYQDKERLAAQMAALAGVLHAGRSLAEFDLADGRYLWIPHRKVTPENVSAFFAK